MYKINLKGEVYNIQRNKIVKLRYKKGYPSIQLSKNKKRHEVFIHKLIIETFMQKRPSLKHNVNHINGIKTDFNLNNLEWVTQKENIYHSRNITRNGAVISKQKIEYLYQQNINISLDNFVKLIIENCK